MEANLDPTSEPTADGPPDPHRPAPLSVFTGLGLFALGGLGWPGLCLVSLVDMGPGELSERLFVAGVGAFLGAAVLALALALVAQSTPGQRRDWRQALLDLLLSAAWGTTLLVPSLVLLLFPGLGAYLVLLLGVRFLLGSFVTASWCLGCGLTPLAARAALRAAERGRRGRRAWMAVGLTTVPVLFLVFSIVLLSTLAGAIALLFLALSAVAAYVGVGMAADLGLELRGELARAAHRSGGPASPAEAGELPWLFRPPLDHAGGSRGLVWAAAPPLALCASVPVWGPLLVRLSGEVDWPTSGWALAAWSTVAVLHVAGLVGGMALLHLQARARRTVGVDVEGLLLDAGPDWPGVRVGWGEVTGWELETDGVRVVLGWGALARWTGPVIPAREREVHELTQLLEGLRIPRLG